MLTKHLTFRQDTFSLRLKFIKLTKKHDLIVETKAQSFTIQRLGRGLTMPGLGPSLIVLSGLDDTPLVFKFPLLLDAL